MKCELITLEGSKYDDDFTEILLTTGGGMMVVLPHHEPFVAALVPGPITIHHQNRKETFAVFGGLLEVTTDGVKILADTAEHSDDLTESEIKEALEAAEKLKASAGSHKELHHAQTLIDRQHVRLNVVKIRSHRRSRHIDQ